MSNAWRLTRPRRLSNRASWRTLRAGALTLTGTDFGEVSAGSAVLFDYGSRSATVISDSPLIERWTSDVIDLSIPWEVVSGELRVVVDGIGSEPVELLVFDYDSVDIPISGNNEQGIFIVEHPLAVAAGPDGSVWLNEEFHVGLKVIASGPDLTLSAVEIPQAEGPGIFAQTASGHSRARFSSLGEDVEIASDGTVWFTQGGANFYPDDAAFLNTSRVINFDPETGKVSCYNLPVDNAAVYGVLIDDARGMVWYSESRTNAISGFRPNSTISDCLFDPYAGDNPVQICSDGLLDSCHLRFLLPNAGNPAHLELDTEGNIWFTESLGNKIGRLTPETGELVELPLPATISQTFPGSWVGGSPWELAFDEQGYLWVSEFFDATVTRIDPALVDIAECEQLDVAGQNPCITEVYVASDGLDGKTIHSVTIDAANRVWFGLEQNLDGQAGSDRAQIGFISSDHDSAVVMLPEIEGVTSVAGIATDYASGDIWFAQYWEHKVGRLHLVTAGQEDDGGDCSPANPEACVDLDTDGDGCTDAEELGPDEQLGGRRDPENFWDFYDTPNQNNDRDGEIDLPNDILSILRRINANDSNGNAEINRYSDPKSPIPADITAYHPAFDRSGPQGDDPWDLGPPDGYINLIDVLGVILQYGHSCSGFN
ncbi:MAG: hypothetical protein J4N98_00205 [Chloroflexi bacterium]|nr:hypothetical protein [Chloroflexota bacterium]